MSFSLRRLGVGQLVGSWVVYWTALGAVTLRPFARWVWELNRIPGQRGSASLSLGDTGATLTALRDGVTVYTGTAPIIDVALWIAGPPLLLWLAWLALRPNRDARDAMRAPQSRAALPDAPLASWPQPITPTSSPSPIERRRDGER